MPDTQWGEKVVAKRVPYALGEKNVLLMQNHGCIAKGETLEVATVRAIIVDAAAHFHVNLQAPGRDRPHGRRAAPRVQATGRRVPPSTAMWQSGFRRLRQSDPDLFAWAAGEQQAQVT